jgi:hypothetical protein
LIFSQVGIELTQIIPRLLNNEACRYIKGCMTGNDIKVDGQQEDFALSVPYFAIEAERNLLRGCSS